MVSIGMLAVGSPSLYGPIAVMLNMAAFRVPKNAIL